MPSVVDQIANKVLQDLYCDIIEQLNTDAVASRLYAKHRITLADLDRLQNIGANLTDIQRKHFLYSSALAEKGKKGLDAFLEVLDDTSIQYEPHALLADKLRASLHAKFKEYTHTQQRGTNRTLDSCRSVSSSYTDAVPPATPRQETFSPTISSTPLPLTNSGTPSDLPVNISSPDLILEANNAVTLSGSSITNMSQVSTVSYNDAIIEESPAEVPDGHPLIRRNFSKSVDEGLGGSMLGIHNPSLVDNDIGEPLNDKLTSPDRHPEDRYPGGVNNLRHVQSDITVTENSSKVVEKESVPECDGVPRTRPVLERSPHSLCGMIPMKLILLGNIGVGKTALMSRFLNNVYNESISSTVGGMRTNCYLTHTAKKVNIKLAIWDTAGQEKFHCISNNFYRNVNVVIMVFDMTDNESRTSLRAVEDWSNQLHRYVSKDVPIILAGNKCESAAVDRSIRRHAEDIVKQLNFDSFMEVSAKEDYQVEELFQRAINLGLKTDNSTQRDNDAIQLSDNNSTEAEESPPHKRKSCRC